MSIQVDLKNLPGLLGKVQAEIVATANTAGLDAEAGVLERQMKVRVGKTYQRPSKYSYTDKETKRKVTRSWKRTNKFQEGVTVEKQDAGASRRVGITGDAAEAIEKYPGGYAEILTQLPVSKDGKSRKNDYAVDTERITRPQRGKAFEQAVRNKVQQLVG